MGCLKNVIRAVVLTLAVIGFLSIGGRELVGGIFGNYFHPSQDTMLERAKKVGDFSQINDEFEIEKAAGLMGYNAVIAEHKASGQKMFVIDTKGKTILTAEDINSNNIEEKIRALLKKFKYQAISVDDIQITRHGSMMSYGKLVPYAKFEAKVKKLPVSDIGGIVSVVTNSTGEQRILISANEKSKYSQLISDEFFKKIK